MESESLVDEEPAACCRLQQTLRSAAKPDISCLTCEEFDLCLERLQDAAFRGDINAALHVRDTFESVLAGLGPNARALAYQSIRKIVLGSFSPSQRAVYEHFLFEAGIV